MRLNTILSGAVVALFLSGCGPAEQEPDGAATTAAPETRNGAPDRRYAAVDERRLRNAANEPEQWMTHGGTLDEQRFSRLDRITTENVGDLALAWYADFDTNTTQQATPLVVDGVVYVTTAWSKVYAYDAASGEQLWQYDPEVPGEQAALGCCGVVNRGAALWNGKVYVGAFDGRLIAIDAASGEQVWSTMTAEEDHHSITGAPRAFRGLVVIGNGGAEYGARGYVTAYDAETGEKVWRFYTVPGNPHDGPDGEVSDRVLEELALPTWSGEFWQRGGGGTAWDSLVYDPDLDLLYVGVGNGSPWNASMRSPDGGDNLFLVSIVALRPDTGEYVWHYQQVPWESWDYTATMPMTLADLEIDGRMRRVLMQAPKNGFFYVLDAESGEFISAENIVEVNWAFGIDPETGRPEVNPEARYDVTGEAFVLQPGPQGARSWNPWSYNPDTGLMYFAARETSLAYKSASEDQAGLMRIGVDWISADSAYDDPDNEIARGVHARLSAWDPVNQREVWSVDTGGGGAGTLSTAGGLVFQAAREEFIAYDAASGERLWSTPLQTHAVAGPVSYAVDGVQYVAQVAGAAADAMADRGPGAYFSSNHSRLLVYRLGGTAQLPPPTPPVELVLDPPPDEATAARIDRGREAYAAACALCHGDSAGNSRGLFPDLRYSPALWNQQLFDMIVLDGQREAQGMPAFADSVSREQSADMRAYVIHLANRLAEQQAGN